MITIKTPLDAFLAWLETAFSLTFGTNLFAGEAPSTNNEDVPLTWVVMSGGANQAKLLTGEKQQIFGFDIYHRDTSFENVQQFAYELTEKLTCSNCLQLQNYETIEVGVSSTPVDNDRDGEGRKVVLVQSTVILNNQCKES